MRNTQHETHTIKRTRLNARYLTHIIDTPLNTQFLNMHTHNIKRTILTPTILNTQQ